LFTSFIICFIASFFKLSIKNFLVFSKSFSDTTFSNIFFHHFIFVVVFAKILILFSIFNQGIVSIVSTLSIFHLSHIGFQYLSFILAIMFICFVQGNSVQFLFFLEPGIFK